MRLALPQIFNGETVTIVGGGPSLKQFDWRRLRGQVIGTNHSMKFHHGQLLVAIDARFHEREREYLDNLDCIKVTYVNTERNDFVVAELEPDHENFRTDHDWNIQACNLSGYFGIAVAFHLGAASVILLGFDGGYDRERETPNFHKWHYVGPGMNYYLPQNKYFDFWKDHNIINVGMGSRIDSFKKVPLESDFYKYV